MNAVNAVRPTPATTADNASLLTINYPLAHPYPLPQPPRQNKDKFKNDCPEGTKNCACWMAKNKYGGFMGPYAMTNVDANL